MQMFKHFLRDGSGATAIEDGVLMVGIAGSIIAAAGVSNNVGNAGQ
jgi:Flp pilus assembly pilin Flp